MFRSILLTFLACASTWCIAQPATPAFCFVLAETGRTLRPLKGDVSVQQRYQERVPYVGINGSWLKSQSEQTLTPGPLFQAKSDRWMVYSPVEAMANSHLLVLSGKDTMRIDLPEDPQPLFVRAWSRSHCATPEVILFRKGRYSIEELIAAPWADAAAKTLADRLAEENETKYKQQLADLEEYYSNQPPPEPPRPPYTPPPPMTEEEWAAEQARLPGLQKVEIERVSADTVWSSITGRIMLDGGCSSSKPFFGLEMLSDTAWVYRLPVEFVQMDCGMPWADWDDHTLMLPPLRWWVAAHQPEGKKELAPGSYRLVFLGGNGKEVRTEAFRID